jgi:actin related protein 2/3 complex subunit 2
MCSPQDRIQTTLADYDGVTYTVSTPTPSQQQQQRSSIIRIAMHMKCFNSELVKYGAASLLQKEYGSYLKQECQDGDVVLEIDVESVVQKDAREDLIRKVSLLKTNAMSAVFEKAFNDQLGGSNVGNEFMVVHYRDEESIFVKASSDRVTVIFSTVFRDETDGVFAKVFLQEFVDCRKQTSLQNAPQVLYTNKEAPMELRGRKDLKEGENVGYVTFGKYYYIRFEFF